MPYGITAPARIPEASTTASDDPPQEGMSLRYCHELHPGGEVQLLARWNLSGTLSGDKYKRAGGIRL
jgi:hypothetical protein